MDLPLWTDAMCIDHGPLDLHHRELLALTSTITARSKAGDSTETETLLHRLLRDCRVHFAAEEAYMDQIGYPYRDEHHEEHVRLLRHVEALLEPGLAASASNIAVVMDCVRSLVLMHILNDDLEIRSFIEGR